MITNPCSKFNAFKVGAGMSNYMLYETMDVISNQCANLNEFILVKGAPGGNRVKAPSMMFYLCVFNTLRPRQNGHHFADDIFKCIFLNENVWISIKSSLKFVPGSLINNIPALVQIMAWRRPGDKPFSEPVMVRLQTHICVTRPQWLKYTRWWNGCCMPGIVEICHMEACIKW